MKFQALLTTLYYLLFSSSAKHINDTVKAVRETRAPKSTTIYHNGRPVEVHGIPQHTPIFRDIQTLASNLAPSKTENGASKVALQRDKVVIKNENTYLQDSYGNRYYNPPQQLAYKMIYPQQFVALQDLPIHFSKPLLGPTQAKQAYTLPQFSFSDSVNRPIQLHSDHGFFGFPKTGHTLPIVLPPQHLNVPIQSHYKISDGVPFISGNHQPPVTFTYHKRPAQRFINFAPGQPLLHKATPNLHTNTQPTGTIVSQKLQAEQQQQEQQQQREPSESRPTPTKQQHPKQFDHNHNQEVKTIEPQYFEPQFFSNPIVPQLQHYLPKIQEVLKYSIHPRPQVPIAEIKEKRPHEEREQQEEKRPHHQDKEHSHEERPRHHLETLKSHNERPQHHDRPQHHERSKHHERPEHHERVRHHEKPQYHQEEPHHHHHDQQERKPYHNERKPQQSDGPIEYQIKEIVSRPDNNIVINEYTPPEKHELKEEVKAEVIDEEENEEKNFNDGYHKAAEGFPAYSYNDDYEKKIFDEASYGEPQYHDSLPFGPSDDYFPSDPGAKRSKYVITGSLQHNAYGEPQEFKPISYEFDGKKFIATHEKKPSGKWSKHSERYKHPKPSGKSEYQEYEVPFHFETPKHGGDKRKSPSKSARYEIDYSKAYSPSERHSQEYRHEGHRGHEGASARFVEPQYQYGFEPIFESRQDSEEQASSASSLAPDSEVRPSTMKKVYKENWFISKTSSEADS